MESRRLKVKTISSDEGKPLMEVIDYDGYLFPNHLRGYEQAEDVDILEFLDSLNQLEFFHDEVAIVSYPRSGTHWTFELCNMLKSGSSDFIDTMVPNFDYSPDEELVDAKNKSRVYTSHLYPRHFPKQFLEKCCKIILVYRNPKDVAASYFNINNKMKSYNEGGLSFSEFLKCYLSGNVACGSWVNWMKEWKTFKKENPEYPFLEIAYEDMKKNLKESVQEISDFLGLNSPPELIEDIAKKCEFRTMSAHKNANVPEPLRQLTNTGNEQSHIIYGKGYVGSWKDHFTVAENEAFDKSLEASLSELGLNLTYEL
ncbi:3-beta-hydroxysteroid sulfotransferase-like isoform X2 [Ostrea edulis]|uniref:3-beta-hydroxysteroid sulfotransferase-like isoform X2 n=1 Tax=Ostrea edulis TaxID=37623 RepID=UPI002094C206|nr:3-beta-hydroxysteroid sulfotransferase-like isoform X2 [Ostrea edulis]